MVCGYGFGEALAHSWEFIEQFGGHSRQYMTRGSIWHYVVLEQTLVVSSCSLCSMSSTHRGRRYGTYSAISSVHYMLLAIHLVVRSAVCKYNPFESLRHQSISRSMASWCAPGQVLGLWQSDRVDLANQPPTAPQLLPSCTALPAAPYRHDSCCPESCYVIPGGTGESVEQAVGQECQLKQRGVHTHPAFPIGLSRRSPQVTTYSRSGCSTGAV